MAKRKTILCPRLKIRGNFVLNRLALLLLVILVCAIPLIAQTKKNKSNSRARSPQPGTELIAVVDEHMPEVWKQFTSTEGQFSVLFPGKPQEITEEHNVQEGKFTTHLFQLISPNAEYEVSFVEFPVRVDVPEKIRGTLDALRVDTLEKDKGQLLTESDISIAGHPGRYIVWRTEKGMIWRAKYFLSGNRIYLLSFGMPEEGNISDETQHFRESIATKFLDSFRMSSRLKQ